MAICDRLCYLLRFLDMLHKHIQLCRQLGAILTSLRYDRHALRYGNQRGAEYQALSTPAQSLKAFPVDAQQFGEFLIRWIIQQLHVCIVDDVIGASAADTITLQPLLGGREASWVKEKVAKVE